ncbi:hypothetical protein HFP15_22375 [Amycolatopsis sp. K13G38]|uniref:Uncharacterized protein n=1 Tax=Amycolatopsis acididurans TaxID=2724524 RepID=A0ABX1J798_9PSEU|nr:hypothetical protein [Amycolatopsis acididurans]NKQ55633.1 hypothetical protein [Amycolatopsis acididurans]
MLRIEPRQRALLVEIARNLTDRMGLKVSLEAARTKLVSLDRLVRNHTVGGLVDIGMPVISHR